jgi:hypothetical protein
VNFPLQSPSKMGADSAAVPGQPWESSHCLSTSLNLPPSFVTAVGTHDSATQQQLVTCAQLTQARAQRRASQQPQRAQHNSAH